MRVLLSAVAITAVALAACGESKSENTEKTDEGPKEAKRSNIKNLSTPVPMGKKVACADLLPDLAKFKELVAEDVAGLDDRSASTASGNASCAILKGGEEMTAKEQERKLKTDNLRLGVLAGEPYCQVTLYCSLATNEADFKKKCEESAKKEEAIGSKTMYEGNTAIGQFSCVRKNDRPPSDWSYTYRTIDEDTRCIFEVMGGPRVVSEEIVQNCTRAALESIGLENLKKFK